MVTLRFDHGPEIVLPRASIENALQACKERNSGGTMRRDGVTILYVDRTPGGWDAYYTEEGQS